MNRLLLFMIAFMVISCKPRATTTLKTIDNFSGQQQKTNFCGPNLSNSKTPQKYLVPETRITVVGQEQQEYKRELQQTLSAAPSLLVKMFLAAGGSFRISPNSVSECPQKLTQAAKQFLQEKNLESVSSCWVKQPSLMLVLPKDRQKIRHSSIRTLTWVVSELLVPLYTWADDREVRNFSRHLQTLKYDLGNALLLDVKNQTDLARLKAMQRNSPSTFANMVFAETIDSYYCNSQTRTTLVSARFQNLFEAFSALGDPSLLAILERYQRAP